MCLKMYWKPHESSGVFREQRSMADSEKSEDWKFIQMFFTTVTQNMTYSVTGLKVMTHWTAGTHSQKKYYRSIKV